MNILKVSKRRRWEAGIMDFTILLLPSLAIAWFTAKKIHGLASMPILSSNFWVFFLNFIFVGTGTLGILSLPYTFFEVIFGSTIGKYILGIAVYNVDGSRGNVCGYRF